MPASVLEQGAKAPDFSLSTTADQTVSLHDFVGKPVVLVFYPAAFSPVCGDEVSIFSQALPQFEKYQAQVLGISTDNVWSNDAFAKEKHVHFPLLSDFHPHGAVGKEYGVFDEQTGQEERALFVIDKAGKVAWQYVSPVGVNPGVDGVLEALQKMK